LVSVLDFLQKQNKLVLAAPAGPVLAFSKDQGFFAVEWSFLAAIPDRNIDFFRRGSDSLSDCEPRHAIEQSGAQLFKASSLIISGSRSINAIDESVDAFGSPSRKASGYFGDASAYFINGLLSSLFDLGRNPKDGIIGLTQVLIHRLD